MFKLNIHKPINYSIKISLLFVFFHFILSLIVPEKPEAFFLIFIPPILTLVNYILFKKNNKDLKFEDYIKSGFIFSIIITIYTAFYCVMFLDVDIDSFFEFGRFPDRDQHIPYMIFIINVIFSSLLSVFFPKGTIREKLGNLVKVVLFVIVIYKLIKPFIGGNDDDDDDEVGFDTDGDGIIDTTFVDTDGDGIAETIAQDTDGDGIIDKISSDTDGDGLIDTVVADTDGDGLIDTIIKDVDLDGDGKSDYRITKRKGKGLT
tara:strand:- start:244 stop:1026 length:783 start_codon:yes stop_codon:yes gene_type:complete